MSTSSAPQSAADDAASQIRLRGVVQGVGFRPFVHRLAHREGLRGTVKNDSSGVTIELWGASVARRRFLASLENELPPGARIDHLDCRELRGSTIGPDDFSIVASGEARERRLSIPPDLATCQECVRELFDPKDRRYRYPFINCTHCGPRFTIANDVPYDRKATTMAPFDMCPDCRREYEDPLDRRYHAQPIACPTCGPAVELQDRNGSRVATSDPIGEAARRLLAGQILAIKGLGGYHLACRADRTQTVEKLRERKRRDHKPFAVMVRDLESARDLARLDPTVERLMTGPEAPIVLVPTLVPPPSALSPEVAPDLDLVGLLLPYTPLHYLLFDELGQQHPESVPLVMTSANLSEHPIVHRDRDCLEKLDRIADAFLVHDRRIEGPADDSVVRIVRERPLLVRRSRGYTPRAIVLAQPVPLPILAVGGQKKNTFCMAVGDTTYFGPHLGDLDNLETYEAFCREIERLQGFLGVEPQLLAHDLHPGYLSTRYALERAEKARQEGRPLSTVAVQHHHAHLASALSDLDTRFDRAPAGQVLGLIWDGTGYGTDGTAWGGELLWGDRASYTRVATLRPITLAGGERAIHEPWRQALAVLLDAHPRPSDSWLRLELFEGIRTGSLKQMRQLLERRLSCPLAHGAGRWFDAFGALCLAEPFAHYEGELALRFERLAASEKRQVEPYPYLLDHQQIPWQIDLRPTVLALTEDLKGRIAPATAAARAHRTLADAAATAINAAARHRRAQLPERLKSEPIDVFMSGGCFNNALLSEQLATRLEQDRSGNLVLHQHQDAPAGDGGLALGQLAVAARLAQRMVPDCRPLEGAALEPLEPEPLASISRTPASPKGDLSCV